VRVEEKGGRREMKPRDIAAGEGQCTNCKCKRKRKEAALEAEIRQEQLSIPYTQLHSIPLAAMWDKE